MTDRLRILVFYIAFTLAIWGDYALGNFRKMLAMADPISGILISLAVSAAISAAYYGISRLLAPKPKPVQQGQLSGTLFISNSAFGVPINRIYGARPEGDNNGGIRSGVNAIWMTDIRLSQTTTPGQSGGGKGAPPAPANIQNHYKVDLACLVGHGAPIGAPDDGLGQGLRVTQIKFNQDVQYNLLGSGGGTEPTAVVDMEAETIVDPGDGVFTVLSGGAAVTADGACSGNFKVTGVGNGGQIVFHGLQGENWNHSIVVHYKSGADPLNAYITIDGGTPQLHGFPASNGAVETISFAKYLNASTHTLTISHPTEACPDIDKIVVFERPIIDPIEDPIGPTGLENEDFPANEAYNQYSPPSPLDEDSTPIERYNLRPVDNADGSINATLPNGCLCTIYEGNELQEPDPWIVADVDTREGAGSTPAYRGFCYIVFKNLEFTKYGTIPNITVVAEHKTLHTVEEILIDLSSLVGLETSDVELSACDAHVRGYLISSVQPPRDTFNSFGEVFNYGFRENLDGEIEGVDLLDRTVIATLSEDDLGVHVSDDDIPLSYVETVEPEFSQVEQEIRVGFFNPLNEHQPDTSSDPNQNSPSDRVDGRDFPITLTAEEGARVAQRLTQVRHHEQAPHSFQLSHKYAWLQSLDRIALPIDGETKHVRLQEISGSAPGVLKVSAVDDELSVFAGIPLYEVKDYKKNAVLVPANTVATFLDIPRLRDAEAGPGVYVYATNRDVNYGAWSGATAHRDKGQGYQHMASFTAPATMGVTVDTLPEVPGGWDAGEWDDTGEVTIDLYYGTLESLTDAEVLDGANIFVVGNEVIGAVNCVRDVSDPDLFPNRWTLSRLQRQLKGTEFASATHITGERVVFLNSAGRYIPLDESELGISRIWKFPTNGQKITHAAPVQFEWGGKSIYPTKRDKDGALQAAGEPVTVAIGDGTGIDFGGSAKLLVGNMSGGIIRLTTDNPQPDEILCTVTFHRDVEGTLLVQLGALDADAAGLIQNFYYTATVNGFEVRYEGTLPDTTFLDFNYTTMEIIQPGPAGALLDIEGYPISDQSGHYITEV